MTGLRQIASRIISGPPVADQRGQELAREIETHWRRFLGASVSILESEGSFSKWCEHLAERHKEVHADALRRGLTRSEADDVARRCWQVNPDVAEKLLTTSQFDSASGP